MGQSRVSKFKLQAEYENRAIKLAQRDMQGLKLQANATDKSLASLGDQTGLDKAAQDANKLKDNLKGAKVEADLLDNQIEKFDVLSSRVGLAGDVQSNLGALTGLAGIAGGGAAGQRIAIAGEVAALVEEIPRLKLALQGLPQTLNEARKAAGASGIGLVGAIGLLTAALILFQKQTQKQREELDKLLSAQRRASDLIAGGATSQDLQQELESLRQQRESAASELNKANGAISEFFETASGNAVYIAAFQKALGIGDATLGALEDTANSAQAEVNALDSEIIILQSALDNGATAAADMAAREIALAEVRQQLADAAIDAQRRAFEEVSDPSFSREALRNRIQGLEREREALEKYIGATGISDELQAQYYDRIQEVNAQLQIYNTLGLETATANDRQRQALEAYKAALQAQVAELETAASKEQEYAKLVRSATVEQTAERIQSLREEQTALQNLIAELEPLARESDDAAKALEQARSRLRGVSRDIDRTFADVAPAAAQRSSEKAAQDIAKIQKDSLDKVTEILRDRQKKELEALQTRDDAIAEAERAAVTSRADAIRTASESIIELERDLGKERERIQRDFGRSFNRALAERDVLAAFEATQQRDDELSDLADSGNERRREIQKQLDDQNRQIDRALQEQTRTANQRYNEQLRTAREAARAAIATEQEKARAEIATRQTALRAELNLLNQGANQAVNIVANQVNGINSVLAQIGRGFNASSVSSTTSKGATTQASLIQNRNEIDRRLNTTLTEAQRSQRTYSSGR